MFIHPLADVQSVDIGADTKIWQYVVVLAGAKIGEGCNINAHCLIENEVTIGRNVTLKCGVYLWNGTTIEDDVFVGPNVTFVNDLFPRSKQRPTAWVGAHIKKGASLGANATILGGVTIGEYAMIGAGSVVTKNVQAHSLWLGNPARFKCYVCVCGQKLTLQNRCIECDRKYFF